MKNKQHTFGSPGHGGLAPREALILAVDDKEANLIALERTLVGVPARLIKATSGEEALAATLRHEFALAILDVQMPGMDGYELAEILLSDTATARIPIIFVTAAYSDEAHQFKGYQSGAVDYLVKPYDPEILLSKVRVFLELAHQRIELQTAKEALKFEHSQLLSILDNMRSLVYVFDRAGREVLFANRATASTLRCGPTKEACVKAVQALDQQCEPSTRAAAEGARHLAAEYETVVRGRNLQLWEQRLLWPDGRETRLVVGNDVTAQKRAEAVLAASEANYRTFFETIDDMIVVVKPDGRLTFANRALERKLGYTAEEVARLHVLDLHPSEHRGEARETFDAMLQGKCSVCPMPVATKSGTVVPVETRVWYGTWNEEDCIFGVIKDLTAEIEAQQRFERLFRSNPSPMALTAVPSGTFFDVNDAFAAAVGYTREEAVGRSSEDLHLFVNAEDQRAVKLALEAVGRVVDADLQVRCKDGRIIEGLFSGEVMSIQGTDYLLTVMIDITARKRAEESLRLATARKQKQAEIVAAVAVSHELADGAVKELAERVTETVAVAFDVGRVGVWLFEDGGTRLVNLDTYVAAVAEHVAGAVLLEHEFQQEFAVLKRDKYVDGSDPLHDPRLAGYVEGYLKPNRITAMLDAVIRLGGAALGALCLEHVDRRHTWTEDEIVFACQLADQLALTIANDRRTKAEAALRDRDRQLRDVINKQFELICRFLPDGTLTFVNDAYCRYFEKDESELVGRRFSPQLPDEDKPFVTAQLSSLTRDNPVVTYQHRVLLSSGQTGWLEWTVLAFFDGKGRPTYYQAAGRDITAQKHAQERLQESNQQLLEATAQAHRMAQAADQANVAKSEFLANMSHELRTPLNAILALSESLLEQLRGPLNERQQNSLRNIEASGRHLLEVINDVLDLAKVEAGRLDIAPEWVPTAEICEASLAFVREMAAAKNLKLRFQPDAPVAEVHADPKRLRQMLVNLLSNAVKFTPAGGRVTLEVEALGEQGAVRFVVEDTGVGIAPEDLSRLFKPFTQLDSSLSRHHEGTGLGLALVQRLAEMHGGNVSVESRLGEGSRFALTLPSGVLGARRRGPTKAAVAPAAASGTRTALLVEDSDIVAAQIAGYLHELGYDVTMYPRGDGAVEEALRLRPGLVVLDLMLPGLSGWEVLDQLKAQPEVRDTPVVIVSVVDEPARARAAGAAGYALKPVSRESLREALRDAVREAPAHGQGPVGAEQQKIKILLVEDNEANVTAVGEYLKETGFAVVVARDGSEALARAVAEKPDIVLMDIQMAGMDGLEATRRLREMPEHEATPVIALTALAMPGDRERCLEAGANEYMTKPVSLRKLVDTIRGQLERA